MHFSLMRFRCLLKRTWYFGPGMTVALAAAMLFALTPCCEVNATSALPHSTIEVQHDGAGHGDDHGSPAAPDDPCLQWVDNNLNAVDTDAGLLIPGRDPSPVPFAALGIAPLSADVALYLQRSCHSPPSSGVPLYLRNEHLLI